MIILTTTDDNEVCIPKNMILYAREDKTDGSPHGYGCPGYAVKTTMKFLKLMGW